MGKEAFLLRESESESKIVENYGQPYWLITIAGVGMSPLGRHASSYNPSSPGTGLNLYMASRKVLGFHH